MNKNNYISLAKKSANLQIKELKKIKNCNIYATISNADTMHNKFSEILFEFEKENNNFKLYHSLNYFDYLFILKNCKFII